MKLIIISGVSGSGKSVALNTLEDQNYLCIDNLPLSLLPALAQQMQQDPGYQHYAVGIDGRNAPASSQDLADLLTELTQHNIQCEIIFLDADDEILFKRFSETRRKHPLSNQQIPLSEAIEQERKLLAPLHHQASLRFNTTHTNVHELRHMVIERISRNFSTPMSLSLVSFGFKHGTPPGADFVFDVRCLPNPHWVPELREQTGLDDDVITFLEQEQAVIDMRQQIVDFIANWLPHFRENNRSYLTIAIGCTGGQHRSVYLVEAIAKRLRATGEKDLLIRHREHS